ncbi:MAG TPA: NADH-quinone oxidoreductase subunit A [Methylomirabilota bacterium]|nr:NADH-quinone oxidoreductase subunit A [Methylomirabilota bacterium]
MPSGYIPLLIFAVLVAAFPAVTLILFKFIRPDSRAVGAKLKPYECGVPAEGDSRGRYSVRFYIIAMLFVIFDVETMFLFPWAIQFKALGILGFVSMIVFLGILLAGYVWLYRKGALDWV